MAGGLIEYQGIKIKFPRAWNRFNTRNVVSGSDVQAMSGVEKSVFFFDQDFMVAEKELETGQIINEVERFYEYARDGSTFLIEQDRDIGTYISFEGGGNSATVPTITPRGLLTNDKVAGTFTRADTADSSWFLDPSTGLMTVVPTTANIPRFEAGKYGHGIRIDGAAANKIDAPSGDFDAGNWAPTNITVANDTSETLDPSGANQAAKLTASAANGNIEYTSATAVGNDVTFACWVKCSSGTVAGTLTIAGTGGGSDTKAYTATTIWTRVFITSDTSGFTTNLKASIDIDTNTEIIYLWGTALFDSAKFDLGTVGALSAAAVTRGAENLKFSSTDIVNKTKGTVGGWCKPSFALGELAADAVLYQCADGASSEVHSQIQFRSAANEIRVLMRKNNDSTVAVTLDGTLTGLLTKDAKHHWGFTYDVTIANGIKVYWDGALLNTSSNSAFNISEIGSFIGIGEFVDGSANASWCVNDDIFISKVVKDATWFNHVFNKGRGYGVKRNRWTVRLAEKNNSIIQRFGDRTNLVLKMKEVLT